MRYAVAPFFQWLGHTPVAKTIQTYSTLISLLETIHLLGLTTLAGTILLIDMTLLGYGLRGHPVSRISSELAPWTLGGLIALLVTGPLLLSSEAQKCWGASFFWIKMAVLLAALIFYFTVHRRTVAAEPPVAHGKAVLVACISLVLWISVAVAGKMIGIYGDDLRQENDPFTLQTSIHVSISR